MADQVTPGPSWPRDNASEAPDSEPRAPRTYGGSGSYDEKGGASGHGGSAKAGERSQLQQAHLVDYVRTVYRHRWIALTMFAVLFLGTAIRTFTDDADLRGPGSAPSRPRPTRT